ncbi:hypothetical protein GCM10022204_10500 [Microlunatus aurantiacus]|uniref:Uncharacterized protein n=1 Tax=Microlunatus aurantiacus TaxID=446786 RepID=A0ABP7CU27_9ACTN
MLATPPPSRAASARNVSADSPDSSSNATASARTASIECDARRRPSGVRVLTCAVPSRVEATEKVTGERHAAR